MAVLTVLAIGAVVAIVLGTATAALLAGALGIDNIVNMLFLIVQQVIPFAVWLFGVLAYVMLNIVAIALVGYLVMVALTCVFSYDKNGMRMFGKIFNNLTRLHVTLFNVALSFLDVVIKLTNTVIQGLIQGIKLVKPTG